MLVAVCTSGFSVIPVYTGGFRTVCLLVQTSSVYQYIGLVQFDDLSSWYYTVQYSPALDSVPVCIVARLALALHDWLPCDLRFEREYVSCHYATRSLTCNPFREMTMHLPNLVVNYLSELSIICYDSIPGKSVRNFPE